MGGRVALQYEQATGAPVLSVARMWRSRRQAEGRQVEVKVEVEVEVEADTRPHHSSLTIAHFVTLALSLSLITLFRIFHSSSLVSTHSLIRPPHYRPYPSPCASPTTTSRSEHSWASPPGLSAPSRPLSFPWSHSHSHSHDRPHSLLFSPYLVAPGNPPPQLPVARTLQQVSLAPVFAPAHQVGATQSSRLQIVSQYPATLPKEQPASIILPTAIASAVPTQQLQSVNPRPGHFGSSHPSPHTWRRPDTATHSLALTCRRRLHNSDRHRYARTAHTPRFKPRPPKPLQPSSTPS
jgi:hypothetical protein